MGTKQIMQEEFVTVLPSHSKPGTADGGALPKDDKKVYRRVPKIVEFFAAPVIGLFYVLALPVIIVVEVTVLAGGKVLGGLLHFLKTAASFTWAPNEAHLTGKRRREAGKEGEVKGPSRKGGKDVYIV